MWKRPFFLLFFALSLFRPGVSQEEIKPASREVDTEILISDGKVTILHNRTEINRRITLDYPLTKADLLQQLQDRLHGVDENLLDQWDQEGRFDSRKVSPPDGDRPSLVEKRYFSSSVSNLLFRYPDVQALRKTPTGRDWGNFVAAMVSEAFHHETHPFSKLLPQRFHNRMTLTVQPHAAPAGDTLRCWLPLPQQNAFQPAVKLLAAAPKAGHIAHPHQMHRSVYLEQEQNPNTPTVFSIEYTYTSYPRIIPINPDRVKQGYPDSVKPWVQEQTPHVLFLPHIKETVDALIGNEHNPYRKAQKLYYWMVEQFNYSYAREYSTLSNISRYCFDQRYGDCGQLALTYITLCRIAGIPARWETGWMLYPHLKNLHDWCVIYISPYGWIPVDVNLGIEARHQWTFLSDTDRQQIIDFYFGNMDPYRMAVNSNHGAEFDPAKTFLRSDTVDFQRGEVESTHGNIYYDQFDYHLEILSGNSIGME